jgi:urease accessory protein
MLDRSAAGIADDVFAGNRACGRISLTAIRREDRTRRSRLHEAGALRIRFPHAQVPDTLEAVIINTAGGIAGGDEFSVKLDVGAGAKLTVTTAAAEKIYRSLGPPCAIDLTLTADANAVLAWLPQETILFDGVRLQRTINVSLAPAAKLILAEAVVFGRAAMGEAVFSGSFVDVWRVRVGGKLVFAENVRLGERIAHRLSHPAVAGGAIAVASLLKVPADDGDVATLRALADGFVGEVGISSWNGLAVARFIAPDGSSLRHDLIRAATAIGGIPLPRLWSH